MKAAYLEQHGGPEVLKIGEIEEPQLTPCKVKIRIKACSINHLDIWVRRGLPHLKLEYPHILGSDIAGEIEEIGEGVKDFKKGDKVILYPAVFCGKCEKCIEGKENFCKEYRILGENIRGGNAEYIVVNPEIIMPYPQNLSFEEASALPLTLLTAMQMVEKSQIKKGEKALVMAAGSGVSVMLIQILKSMGVYVIGCAGNEEKLKKAKEIGADETLNYNQKNWSKNLKNVIDVIFDHTGKNFFKDLVKIVKWGGKIVICGATSGADSEIDLRYVFFKQINIIGSTMGARHHLLKGLKLVRENKIKPFIFQVLPLEEIKRAHILIEERKTFGKIVLRI